MKLLSPQDARALDQRVIEKLGLPGVALMETAGRAVVRESLKLVGTQGDGRLVTVLCGTGNNGGDGFVIARELHYRGFRVHVYGVGDPSKMGTDARVHLDILQSVGVKPRWSEQAPQGGELKGLHRSLLRSALIVDALLGTGIQTELRDVMKTWISQLDGRHDGVVVSVDLPSGLHADTGQSLGAIAQADLVVSFVAAKTGLFLGEGPSSWRQLVVASIGVPPKWVAQRRPSRHALEATDLTRLIPSRDALGHKGTHGHLLVVAGSAGKSGAALLASKSALRSGVGLLTLATAGEIRARIEGLVPDIMVEAVRGGASEAQRVQKLVQGKSAIVIGPGLGTSAAEIDLVSRVCQASEGPIVLDADALTALSGRPELASAARGRLVLTPHPGELSRLMDCSIQKVQGERLSVAMQAAERFDAVVIAKDARPLIVAPDGRWSVINSPTSALSVAGSGDVLSGMVGALLARGLSPYEAACAAALAHNQSGHQVEQSRGATAAVASDLVDALGMVWPR